MLIAQKHYLMTAVYERTVHIIWMSQKTKCYILFEISYLSAASSKLIVLNYIRLARWGEEETIWINESSDGLGFHQDVFFFIQSVYVYKDREERKRTIKSSSFAIPCKAVGAAVLCSGCLWGSAQNMRRSLTLLLVWRKYVCTVHENTCNSVKAIYNLKPDLSWEL